jgi:ParB/RepB/Spo0J family partition protein
MSTATKTRPESGKRKADLAADPQVADIRFGSLLAGDAEPLRQAAAKNGNGKAKPKDVLPRRTEQSTVQAVNLPLSVIDPNPWQPRQEFPKEEIASFAAALAAEGQLQPVAVRYAPGEDGALPDPADDGLRYQLLDGERRLRALKLLGWPTIRAEIGAYSDAQMRSGALAAALQRKDLNAIEEARAFQAMLAAGDADGPTQLAQRLGLSQGQVSNRLRLLELPANVQAKVISREISASNARALVPLAAAPAALAHVIEEAKNRRDGGDELGTTEFLDVIDNALRQTCRLIATHTDRLCRGGVPAPKLSSEQRAALKIIKHTPPWRGAKPFEYASNAKLYDEIYEQHKQAFLARAATKAEKGGKPKAKGEKPLTAAEKKRLAEQERGREKDRAEKLGRGVWGVAIAWRRVLLAEACRERQVSMEDLLRLLLYFSASQDWHRGAPFGYAYFQQRLGHREDMLGDQLKARGRHVGPDLLAALRGVDDREMSDRALDFLATMFWDAKDGPDQVIPDEAVLAIAEQLALDLAAAWKKDAAGELTKRWLELRNQEALLALGKQAGVTVEAATKTAAVAALLKCVKKLKPPQELLKPKKPK